MNYVGNEPAPPGLVLVGDTNPVGSIIWRHSVPDGSYLQLNGQVVSKTTYADLWAYAQGFLTADQVANPGLYRSVDGNTFAVPKLDGLFIRGIGQVDANHVAAALGVKQVDMVGPFTLKGIVSTAVGGGGVNLWRAGVDSVDMPAVTYQTPATVANTETRGVNVALVPCVKALRTVLMPSSALPAFMTPQVLGPVATTSGTSKDITGISAAARYIRLALASVSTDNAGAWTMKLQVGPSAGVVSAGYVSIPAWSDAGGGPSNMSITDAFSVTTPSNAGAGAFHSGHLELSLVDPAVGLWACSSVVSWSIVPGGNSFTAMQGGHVQLGAGVSIERLRLFLTAGNFDLGAITAYYQ